MFTKGDTENLQFNFESALKTPLLGCKGRGAPPSTPPLWIRSWINVAINYAFLFFLFSLLSAPSHLGTLTDIDHWRKMHRHIAPASHDAPSVRLMLGAAFI